MALAQEVPDASTDEEPDEQWELVEPEEPLSGHLVADEAMGDDDYALVVDDLTEFAPEELAIHLVTP